MNLKRSILLFLLFSTFGAYSQRVEIINQSNINERFVFSEELLQTIKQNLKLKKFLGKSENSVKIQITTAIIAYLLVQIYKNNSGDDRRLQLVLVWVRCNLNIRAPKYQNYTPPIYLFKDYREGVQL